MKLPIQKASLVTLTANTVRDALKNGSWDNFLPGIRSLRSHFQVGLHTMRAALKMLHREGFIQIRHGEKTRILVRHHKLKFKTSKIVIYLLTKSFLKISPYALYRIYELQNRLSSAGYKLEIHTAWHSKKQDSSKILEEICAKVKPCCWILAEFQFQNWFQKRDLPVIIDGARYPNISLPYIDMDFRAMGHHAVNTFITMGHRNIVLMLTTNQREMNPSILALKEGYFAALKNKSQSIFSRIFSIENSQKKSFFDSLSNLFKSKNRPTALLIACRYGILTIKDYLLELGFHIPKDLVIISALDERFLGYLRPNIARYTVDQRVWSRKFSRLVIQLATTGHVFPKENLMIPELFPGESLKRLSL